MIHNLLAEGAPKEVLNNRNLAETYAIEGLHGHNEGEDYVCPGAASTKACRSQMKRTFMPISKVEREPSIVVCNTCRVNMDGRETPEGVKGHFHHADAAIRAIADTAPATVTRVLGGILLLR